MQINKIGWKATKFPFKGAVLGKGYRLLLDFHFLYYNISTVQTF